MSDSSLAIAVTVCSRWRCWSECGAEVVDGASLAMPSNVYLVSRRPMSNPLCCICFGGGTTGRSHPEPLSGRTLWGGCHEPCCGEDRRQGAGFCTTGK